MSCQRANISIDCATTTGAQPKTHQGSQREATFDIRHTGFEPNADRETDKESRGGSSCVCVCLFIKLARESSRELTS